MRNRIAVLLLLVYLTPAIADSAAAVRSKAAQAIADALKEHRRAAEPVKKPKMVKTYAEAYRLAIERRMPLIVFLHQSPRKVPGCISCEAGGYPRAPDGPCVIVNAWRGDTAYRIQDLVGRPNNDKILRAVHQSPELP